MWPRRSRSSSKHRGRHLGVGRTMYLSCLHQSKRTASSTVLEFPSNAQGKKLFLYPMQTHARTHARRSQPRPQDVLMLAGSVVGATVAQVQSMTRPPVGPLPLPLASISFSNPFMQHSTQRRSCKSQEVLGELAGAAESTPGGVPAPSAPSTAPTTSASTPTSTQGDTGSASLRGPASDPTAPTPTSSSASSSSSSGAAGPVSDGRVLVSEIDVAGPGVTEEMRQVALRQLQARPNYAYTDREILSELERLVDTGYFQAGRIVTDDTRDGVKLTFQMVPWKEVKSVVVSGTSTSLFLSHIYMYISLSSSCIDAVGRSTHSTQIVKFPQFLDNPQA